MRGVLVSWAEVPTPGLPWGLGELGTSSPSCWPPAAPATHGPWVLGQQVLPITGCGGDRRALTTATHVRPLQTREAPQVQRRPQDTRPPPRLHQGWSGAPSACVGVRGPRGGCGGPRRPRAPAPVGLCQGVCTLLAVLWFRVCGLWWRSRVYNPSPWPQWAHGTLSVITPAPPTQGVPQGSPCHGYPRREAGWHGKACAGRESWGLPWVAVGEAQRAWAPLTRRWAAGRPSACLGRRGLAAAGRGAA